MLTAFSAINEQEKECTWDSIWPSFYLEQTFYIEVRKAMQQYNRGCRDVVSTWDLSGSIETHARDWTMSSRFINYSTLDKELRSQQTCTSNNYKISQGRSDFQIDFFNDINTSLHICLCNTTYVVWISLGEGGLVEIMKTNWTTPCMTLCELCAHICKQGEIWANLVAILTSILDIGYSLHCFGYFFYFSLR